MASAQDLPLALLRRGERRRERERQRQRKKEKPEISSESHGREYPRPPYAECMPALPDVPTISEAGLSGFEASNFFGLVGPPRIPPAIVQKINAAFVRVIKEEVAKWAKVVKESGARID